MIWLIFITAMLISLFGAMKDGLSDRYRQVGWLWWHGIGWKARDIPIFLCLVMMYIVHAPLWMFIIILITRPAHFVIYKVFRKHAHLFYGSPDPPEWYRKLRRLWSWMFDWIDV